VEYKANKTDKARTIVCAFYNLPDLPKGDDPRVRKTKRQPLRVMNDQWIVAKRMIAERINRE
jgi:redox-sensitive bicupin YhaK (pirin superfamily)